jgi:hypothetical protein
MTPTMTRTATKKIITPVMAKDLEFAPVFILVAEFLGVNQFAPLFELPEPEFNGSRLFISFEFPLVLI